MNKTLVLFLFLTGFLVLSCKTDTSSNSTSDEHDELSEDQAELEEAYRNQKKISRQVFAAVETEPVAANESDDAADDPAIWYNKMVPSESIVFGSNKKGGIVAYNLGGEKIQYYEVGNVNNIDVIYDFYLDGRTIDILGGSNRSTQGIDLFEITKEGSLKNLSGDRFLMDTTEVDDIYGFCFGQSSDGRAYVFINGKNGLVRQYEMEPKDGAVDLNLVREVQLDSQPEGMVVSQERQTIYLGEEAKGIWLMDINPDSTSRTLIPNSGEDNEHIKYDVEGLTIMQTKGKEWLMASSQGNFSYAVFDMADNHSYLGSFVIADGEGIDGAEETDGIDVITDSLSVQFPKGIFIAQDGFNYQGEQQRPQNFKIVDLQQILDAFGN
jgi:3-phytase